MDDDDEGEGCEDAEEVEVTSDTLGKPKDDVDDAESRARERGETSAEEGGLVDVCIEYRGSPSAETSRVSSGSFWTR